MASPVLKHLIRIFAAVCVLIASALVAWGKGVCLVKGVYDQKITDCNDETIPIAMWREIFPPGGQYFVFISSLILVLAFIGAIICAARGVARKLVLSVAVCGIVVSFLNLCLEGLYAGGSLTLYIGLVSSNLIIAYDQCWAAATALYILSGVSYIIDFILTYRQKPVNQVKYDVVMPSNSVGVEYAHAKH